MNKFLKLAGIASITSAVIALSACSTSTTPMNTSPLAISGDVAICAKLDQVFLPYVSAVVENKNIEAAWAGMNAPLTDINTQDFESKTLHSKVAFFAGMTILPISGQDMGVLGSTTADVMYECELAGGTMTATKTVLDTVK